MSSSISSFLSQAQSGLITSHERRAALNRIQLTESGFFQRITSYYPAAANLLSDRELAYWNGSQPERLSVYPASLSLDELQRSTLTLFRDVDEKRPSGVEAHQAEIVARRLSAEPVEPQYNNFNTWNAAPLSVLRNSFFKKEDAKPWEQGPAESRTVRIFSALTLGLSIEKDNQGTIEPLTANDRPSENSLKQLARRLTLTDLLSCSEKARLDATRFFCDTTNFPWRLAAKLQAKIPGWADKTNLLDISSSSGPPYAKTNLLYPATFPLQELARLPLSFFYLDGPLSVGRSPELIAAQFALAKALLETGSYETPEVAEGTDIRQVPIGALFGEGRMRFFSALLRERTLTPDIAKALLVSDLKALAPNDLALIFSDQTIFDTLFPEPKRLLSIGKEMEQLSTEQLVAIAASSSDAIWKEVTSYWKYAGLKLETVAQAGLLFEQHKEKAGSPDGLNNIASALENLAPPSENRAEFYAARDPLFPEMIGFALSAPNVHDSRDNSFVADNLLRTALRLNPLPQTWVECVNAREGFLNQDILELIVEAQEKAPVSRERAEESLIPRFEAYRDRIASSETLSDTRKAEIQGAIAAYLARIDLTFPAG